MKIQDIRRKKLAEWVKTHSVPQAEKSYFSQLMSGASFGERSARRLERDYKMGDGYLDTDEEKQLNVRENQAEYLPKSSDMVIPQYKDHGGAMGTGVMLRDQPGEIHAFQVTPDWVSKNVKSHTGAQNLCIVTGFGDSMRPLYNPGDPLIMDRGVTTVDYDGIYFFRIGDEGFIKRLQRIPGQGLLAISQNKDYRDWVITPEMDFEVFGRIVKAWAGSDF